MQILDNEINFLRMLINVVKYIILLHTSDETVTLISILTIVKLLLK